MQGADFLFFRKTYGPQAWQVKWLHPEKQMTIDYLSFVMLNLYKIDNAIDKCDGDFMILTNGLENTFNTS